MYKLNNITVHYTSHRGHRVTALENISLDIRKGTYLAVTGPSGSGKSTLLMTLGGMLTPEEGTVFIEGISLYEANIRKRARIRNNRIGMVFQTFNLIPYLSALENIEIPLLITGSEKTLQREKALELLQEVGLLDWKDHLPSELSVGQQQRVALARMMANNPDIILADEPTGSLDPETGSHILDFLDNCSAQGRTVILVTHDLQAAARAEVQYRLDDGQLTRLR